VPVWTLYGERNFVSLARISPHIVHCVAVCCSEVQLVPTIRLLVIVTENTAVHHGLDSNLSCVHEKVDVN
jgi:hypothetical protein